MSPQATNIVILLPGSFSHHYNKMPILILLHISDEATSCEEGSLRLQGGVDNSSGIVEYCKYRTWGTLCNDGWDDIDASVACRQLGFESSCM